MKKYTAACIVLVLCLEAAVAQQDVDKRGLNRILADAGYNLWAQLLVRANLADAINPKSRATLLAPDNRAVRNFLRRMSGMNYTELLARPQLVGLMASYHIIPGVTITDSGKAYSTISTDEDNPSVVTTGDINSIIEVWSNPTSGVVSFRDAHQRVGYVTEAAPAYSGAISIWGISEVLMSGAYFDSVMDATTYYRPLTVFRELNARSASATGNADAPFEAIETTSEPTTQFVPIDAAWLGTVRAFATNPSPGKAQNDLARLMDYMTLNGMRSIPTGFVHNQSVETALKGHSMSPRLGVMPGTNPFTGKSIALPSMVVVPEVGGASKVVLANIYAGKGIIHAVDNVFAPSGIPSLAKIAQVAQRAVIPPAKAAAQPPGKAAAQPQGKAAAQPQGKTAVRPAAPPATKPPKKNTETPPEAIPAKQPPAKPATKPPAQPQAKATAQLPTKAPAQAPAATAAQSMTNSAAEAAKAAAATAKPAAKTGRGLLARMRLERVNNIAQVDAAAWASSNARDALSRTAAPGVPAAYAARYGQTYSRYAECLNCRTWGVTL